MNDLNQPAPVYVESPSSQADDEIDLRQLVGILLAGKWIIAGTTAAVLVLGILYALLATPVYQSNVLLQVNEDNQAYQAGALSDLAASLNGRSPPADTQIAIMTSRSVVGHAVDKLALAIDAEPDYFPLIGHFIARHYDGDQPASPWLWLSGYAWGGEAIKVTRLNVPREWWNQPLTLMAGAPGHYILYDPDGNRILKGEVGKPVYSGAACRPAPAISASSADHLPFTTDQQHGCAAAPSIFVSVLHARPGTRFNVTRHPRLAVIKTLQGNLSVSERGKGTNIVSMRLDGARPNELVSILDTLAQTYVEQNVQNNAQQAQESLKFLRTQLPKVKAQADAAQLALAQYQAKHQALDISADTTSLLAQMVNIQQQISELKLKETEMGERFNAGFPGLQAVRAQIGQMQQIKAKLEARINNVPKAEQQIFKLKRDVEVNNGLYTALLNQAQQLEVAQAGTVGNARIIDHAALPIGPVKPKRTLIAVLSLMLGLMLGTFTVFVRQAMARSVTDPNEVEAIIEQPVYAVIPYSRAQRRAERAARSEKSPLPVLAQIQPEDLAVESLRSLRTSLHFALLESHGNVVMMTSPGPGAGKSFSSMNLATLARVGGTPGRQHVAFRSTLWR